MDKNIYEVVELDDRKVVVINDIRFRSRQNIPWNEVENYLKEYIGEYFEILETSDKVYRWRFSW